MTAATPPPAVSDKGERMILLAVLVLAGAGWGLTIPLAKIAVTGGYRAFGLIFWQQAVAVICLGLVCLLTGRRLPVGRGPLTVWLVVALVGTLLPNSGSLTAAIHLPSGVMSILLSLVPVLAFPVALLLRTDRFHWGRMAGLMLGLGGVTLLVAPEASLPDRAMAVFIPLGLIAPLFYAMEGNIVARWGTAGMDPIQVLFGASAIGALLSLPLALATGQWIDPTGPWAARDWAMLGSSLIHAVVYTAYVWLVARAGAVFAVQVSYLVTGFGVFWAMLILGETYSPWIWAAAGLIVAGMLLVQPRPKPALAPAATV